MTLFTLNPDKENQVISLVVPVRFAEGGLPTKHLRLLLTGYDSAVSGLGLFHDPLPPAYAARHPRLQRVLTSVTDYALVQSLESFRALVEGELPEVITPSPEHGMVTGAHMVKQQFEQSNLAPEQTLLKLGERPLGSMSQITAPKTLRFTRLLPVGEENVVGLAEGALKKMRQRLN